MADIRPAQPLRQGRYHLDRYGRLHAAPPRGTRTVAIVIVRMKLPEPSAAPAAPVKVAPPPRELPPTRPMARRAKPTVVHVPEDVLSKSTPADDAMTEFYAKLQAVRARRGKGTAAEPATKVDGAKIAAAHRAKPLGPPPKKIPTRRALSDGECHQCGTRTTIGCEHFLPFEGGTA
jgi:hypothetical protein